MWSTYKQYKLDRKGVIFNCFINTIRNRLINMIRKRNAERPHTKAFVKHEKYKLDNDQLQSELSIAERLSQLCGVWPIFGLMFESTLKREMDHEMNRLTQISLRMWNYSDSNTKDSSSP